MYDASYWIAGIPHTVEIISHEIGPIGVLKKAWQVKPAKVPV